MPELVWLNGRFMSREDATVSVFDAGLQHAVGLFETMLGAQGRVFRIERHMARLAASAAALGLSESLRPAMLAEAVDSVVQRSGLAEGQGRARVRLTITGGALNMLPSAAASGQAGSDPTILIVATPATAYPQELIDRGVSVRIADARANPFEPGAGHKTLNYWWRLRELQQAGRAGASEAIVLQVSNHVAGGCVSNLMAAKDGVLLTPIAQGEEVAGAIPSPVLPGVTRGAILEFAAELRINAERRMMTIADVLDADEVFLTNSSWGVLPVVKVEGKRIGSGEPGGMTRRLRERWLEAVRDEP